MLIRKATEKDFEQYFKLNKISNKELGLYYFNQSTGIDEKIFKKNILKLMKKKEWLFLVAEEKNKILGFFEGYIKNNNQGGYTLKIKHEGYVNNVFVKKEHRGKNLFQMFQKEFENYLKLKNIKHCTLHVSSINIPAIKAYKKMNYKIEEYKMYRVIK